MKLRTLFAGALMLMTGLSANAENKNPLMLRTRIRISSAN